MVSTVAGCLPVPRSRGAVARWSGDGADVRCAACSKLLFKVKRSPDSTLTIERACRGFHAGGTCGLRNQGRVTEYPGIRVANSLPEAWQCSGCGSRLARVSPVKGRIAVWCRCGAKVAVTATDAIQTVELAACAG